MKEATGELNASVFVIMAVGVLIAFFYYTIWPLIKENIRHNTDCSKAICELCMKDGNPSTDCDLVWCHEKGVTDESKRFQCVYKG